MASISLKDTLYPKEQRIKKDKVDFNTLSSGFEATPAQMQAKPSPLSKRGRPKFGKHNAVEDVPKIQLDKAEDDDDFIDF